MAGDGARRRLVFLTRRLSPPLIDAMLGLAAGVMVAASVGSLLVPAIELTEFRGQTGWLPATIGIALGDLFLRVLDQFLSRLHPRLSPDQA